MKPKSPQLTQRFSERRGVAKIAAGQHDPVRRIPVALIQHFENDGFLSLNAERIDRVEQVNAQALGQHAHQREDLIEVGFHLQACERHIPMPAPACRRKYCRAE